jgi:hypothetical protein
MEDANMQNAERRVARWLSRTPRDRQTAAAVPCWRFDAACGLDDAFVTNPMGFLKGKLNASDAVEFKHWLKGLGVDFANWMDGDRKCHFLISRRSGIWIGADMSAGCRDFSV